MDKVVYRSVEFQRAYDLSGKAVSYGATTKADGDDQGLPAQKCYGRRAVEEGNVDDWTRWIWNSQR